MTRHCWARHVQDDVADFKPGDTAVQPPRGVQRTGVLSNIAELDVVVGKQSWTITGYMIKCRSSKHGVWIRQDTVKSSVFCNTPSAAMPISRPVCFVVVVFHITVRQVFSARTTI